SHRRLRGCSSRPGQLSGHLIEDRDEAIGVVDRMRNREGPLLLSAGSHEDAAVHVEQPRQGGQLYVLSLLESFVVDDLLGGERHATLTASSNWVGRQAIAVDDLTTPPQQALV